MASACCSYWLCPCERLIKLAASTQQTGSRHPEHTESVLLPTDMDIAVLKEQYNSIKEKQRHQTRVICFSKEASNSEDICGKSVVKMVPMRQDQPSLKRPASLQDNSVDFIRDPDRATWHTHLIMYRRCCLTSDTSQHSKVNTSTRDKTSSVSVNSAECSVEEADLSPHLSKVCDETDSDSLFVNKKLEHFDSVDLGFRKRSGPGVLTRQLSCGSYRSGHNSESPCYYPFPQLKSPRKSEAARRLGLYSSF